MRLKKIYLLIVAVIFFSAIGSSQTKYNIGDYKKKPVWIQMMNDTSVNYFETVKAFREYYEDRALPKEANEVEGKDSFEEEIGLDERAIGGKKSKKERKREKRKPNPKEINYAAEVRAFKGWFYGTKPWVRRNGSIIGPGERQAIVDRQQAELKQIEKANSNN